MKSKHRVVCLMVFSIIFLQSRISIASMLSGGEYTWDVYVMDRFTYSYEMQNDSVIVVNGTFTFEIKPIWVSVSLYFTQIVNK